MNTGTEPFIGMHKTELDTPALLIDLDKMEANIQTMADYLSTVDTQPETTHENA